MWHYLIVTHRKVITIILSHLLVYIYPTWPWIHSYLLCVQYFSSIHSKCLSFCVESSIFCYWSYNFSLFRFLPPPLLFLNSHRNRHNKPFKKRYWVAHVSMNARESPSPSTILIPWCSPRVNTLVQRRWGTVIKGADGFILLSSINKCNKLLNATTNI